MGSWLAFYVAAQGVQSVLDFSFQQDVHEGFQQGGEEAGAGAEGVDVGGAGVLVAEGCVADGGGEGVEKGGLVC